MRTAKLASGVEADEREATIEALATDPWRDWLPQGATGWGPDNEEDVDDEEE